MEVVVMKGPYTIRSMPVVLKEWRPDFSLKQDMLRTIPIWIKLPKLPLYLCYGIHWLLNFSTAGHGKPEGVLIRGVLAGPEGAEKPVTGPGNVTRHLGIDKALYGADATSSREIWIEDRGVKIPDHRVMKGPRVGVDYAGAHWAAKPWRFRIAIVPADKGTRRKTKGTRREKRR